MQALALFLALSSVDPEVTNLIKQLDNDSFRVREAASAKLLKMDERPIRFLRIAAEKGVSAEVRLRARRIVDHYENVKPSKYNKLPWIDHLPKDFPDRAGVIKRHLEVYSAEVLYDYSEWRALRWATRQLCRDLFKRGWDRRHVIELLDKMSSNEQKWLKNKKDNPYKPIFDLCGVEEPS